MSDSERTALVTGATRGIGFATAVRLARAGYRVVVTGRAQAGSQNAAQLIRTEVPGSTVFGLPLDLAALKSVRTFVDLFQDTGWPLHLLVNNAGMAESGTSVQLTEDGIESTLATNVIGPFLLTLTLLPKLVRSAPARIVNVSSRMHMPSSGMGGEVDWDWNNLQGQKAYDPMTFYKNSKLAVMWFTYELNRRLTGKQVTVNAVCPGFVPETIVARGGVPEEAVAAMIEHSPWPRSTVAQAADNTVFAATAPKYATSGGLFIAEQTEIASSPRSYDQAEAQRFWELASELVDLPAAGTR